LLIEKDVGSSSICTLENKKSPDTIAWALLLMAPLKDLLQENHFLRAEREKSRPFGASG